MFQPLRYWSWQISLNDIVPVRQIMASMVMPMESS